MYKIFKKIPLLIFLILCTLLISYFFLVNKAFQQFTFLKEKVSEKEFKIKNEKNRTNQLQKTIKNFSYSSNKKTITINEKNLYEFVSKQKQISLHGFTVIKGGRHELTLTGDYFDLLNFLILLSEGTNLKIEYFSIYFPEENEDFKLTMILSSYEENKTSKASPLLSFKNFIYNGFIQFKQVTWAIIELPNHRSSHYALGDHLDEGVIQEITHEHVLITANNNPYLIPINPHTQS